MGSLRGLRGKAKDTEGEEKIKVDQGGTNFGKKKEEE